MKKENQLLNRVLKAVGIGTEAKTEEVVVEAEATEAPVETLEIKVDASAVQDVAADLQAQIDAISADLGAKLEVATAALEDMTAKFEAAQAALNAIEAEKAEMIAKAAAAKLSARKEKIVAAIGTEKADGLMAATEGLDDTAFEAVVSALVGSVVAEAKTDLFQEVGVTAEADAVKVVDESEEMRLLKQKYNGTK